MTGFRPWKEEDKMKLITVQEAAERLGVKQATIRAWIYRREIDYVKLHRSVRLREETIQALAEDGTVPALKTRR
jgi:excisionase family DNA binding protein